MNTPMNRSDWPRFLTIRQAARDSGLPEHALRVLVKRGKIPGFYAGTRFMVNIESLREQLTKTHK